MPKLNLEKFDSPTVLINQAHEGEDWGVTARYVSKQDAEEAAEELSLTKVGWRISVTLPDFDEVEFDQVFNTLDAALEFGVAQIISGNLSPGNRPESNSFSITHYHSIAC